VTRSVSQVHALLYVSESALTADEIAEKLDMARSKRLHVAARACRVEPDPARAGAR
jgi:DNA-binding transcriptional regulator GbsR (MarR family)